MESTVCNGEVYKFLLRVKLVSADLVIIIQVFNKLVANSPDSEINLMCSQSIYVPLPPSNQVIGD